ncbi:mechanosensitive ion channel family protein [Actinospica sp.]|jgi:hypothetical protein|uniref:mechanosensitive ion channel family protein n=1 Tax=Actinospica sp. TaxID=1872142 RepID=UPI002BEC27E9|nr:hypothetical protein [Actinospica sp.]HWG27655.1 hypothetical protein [Actinospica sp.]
MHHTQQIYVAGVDWTGGINSMWNSFTTWVPRFVGFLLVLVIGWMIAKVIGKAVEAVLRRLHFERVMERAGMSRALENSKYDGSKLVGMIAYYLMLLIVLQVAFGVFGSNPINTVLRSILAWIPRGLVAIAIIVIAAMIARAVRELVANMLSSLSYGRTMGNAVGICIIALGVFAALGQAGIATAVSQPVLTAILATVAGVLIVGVGGGMIRPMQQRWERMLSSAEREATAVAGSVGTGRMASSGEAYTAGHMHGTQAAEEEARRAREGMTNEGGMPGPNDPSGPES